MADKAVEIKVRVWDSFGERYEDFKALRVQSRTVNGVIDQTGFEEGLGDRYMLERYTGLKDKELKEIYEGDIVQLWHEGYGYMGEEATTDVTSVIKFVNGAYWLDNEPLYAYPDDDLEVIGNIHENPELLEVK
ncbi:YopX family protein [Weissella confusa]|uniref:YopX family protein n=1 Tax=Weissella confusa TaxID=1583 RepID=UPI001C6F930D|nr:YopX family protein [Weissella confusa]QYU58191.1 YopX family protein [Weissella confusa]